MFKRFVYVLRNAFERYLKIRVGCCVRPAASAIVRPRGRYRQRQFAMVEPTNVGHLAELYLAGRLSFQEFMLAAPEDPEDEDVAELIDLIEHEPKRGGFFGASAEEHDRHMARIRELASSISSRDAR
jgi:hypothetical protein